MLINSVLCGALLLTIFTLINSQQTICCYLPCFIPTNTMTHPFNNMKIPTEITTESILGYILYAPIICPQGHQPINGVCRKIYYY